MQHEREIIRSLRHNNKASISDPPSSLLPHWLPSLAPYIHCFDVNLVEHIVLDVWMLALEAVGHAAQARDRKLA
jgi:hypothetical protein